jgi:dihydropteroate synthase
MPELYLRPIGFAHVPNRERIDEVRGALPLAGNRHLDFLGLEVIERRGKGVTLKTISIAELNEVEWGRRAIEVSGFFNALLMPRKAMAGLSMDRPHIMGVINVTPDSFSDGGALPTAQSAIDHGLRLAEAGAAILDIGGESTRPGAEPVPHEAELSRVRPVIEGLKGRSPARLSIDTRNAAVMRAALAAGADVLNDVSALTYDPESMAVAANSRAPVVLMHAQGDPRTMQQDPRYDHVALEVFDYLEARIAACEAAGIERARLIADPGIGFGKTLAHNLELLAGLSLFHGLGVPVMVGASRKRFIGTLSGVEEAARRAPGSIGAALAAVAQGAQFVRVHDVAETAQALKVWQAAVTGVVG